MLGFLKRRGERKPGEYRQEMASPELLSDPDFFEELSLDALLQSDVVQIMMSRDGITDRDIRLLAAYTSQQKENRGFSPR